MKHMETQTEQNEFDCAVFTNLMALLDWKEGSDCRVGEGTGSQSVVVCVAKYPGGESQRQVL